jgi:hypothetical protein
MADRLLTSPPISLTRGDWRRRAELERRDEPVRRVEDVRRPELDDRLELPLLRDRVAEDVRVGMLPRLP